ncbi:hypothetical protein ACIRN5_23725, partial [Lysinibacillus fusiformis]|uniref:hypothetical protein n=1 Tax=Lysinibacillus fusiformis TaxID=28031 RepID=UPI0037FCF832
MQEALAASSLPSVSTEGDLECPERLTEAQEGSGPAEMPVEASGAAVSASADFHAPHALVATPGDPVDEVDGFSGACAVGVDQRRPERASARENAPESDLPRLRLVGGEDGPLRGEQPENSSSIGTTPGPQMARQPRRGHLYAVTRTAPPTDLAMAIAPVLAVWECLDRPWLRDRAATAVREQLTAIGRWTGESRAPEVLAERLKYRLKLQGG